MLFSVGSERGLIEALTMYNYFPNQKEGVSEIPPCFSTINFTPEIAKKLHATDAHNKRKIKGFDQVNYSITRHNNVPRNLGLIHPYAYSKLACHIYDNWDYLQSTMQSNQSVIKPTYHADGRIIVMNYESAIDKFSVDAKASFSSRFRVHTDIANFYHSIYTHSVEWAVFGYEDIKNGLKSNSNKNHWARKLDNYLAQAQRNETQGITIGPATSNVIVELILGRVDKFLESRGYSFRRYIDDYVCYCGTHEIAQMFLRELGKKLSEYRLSLNLHKTKIVELPEPIADAWISELSSFFVGFTGGESSRNLSSMEIVNYMDLAVRINKRTPDGSVLKYAVSTILSRITPNTSPTLLDYTLNLSFHYPILIPFLEKLFSSEGIDHTYYSKCINSMLVENARNRRSDGMCWLLYIMKKYSIKIDSQSYSEVLISEDCLAILSLYKLNLFSSHIIDFCNNLFCKNDYIKDQYWILLYQLYIDGEIGNPFSDNVFEVLRSYDVDFMPESSKFTKAQSFCNQLSNPFLDDPQRVFDFDEYMKIF
jgi:hypothetical protein